MSIRSLDSCITELEEGFSVKPESLLFHLNAYKKLLAATKPVVNIKGTVQIPKLNRNCVEDAKKACGVYPYNEGSNYLAGDGYFSRSCIDKYGEKQWKQACDLVRRGSSNYMAVDIINGG